MSRPIQAALTRATNCTALACLHLLLSAGNTLAWTLPSPLSVRLCRLNDVCGGHQLVHSRHDVSGTHQQRQGALLPRQPGALFSTTSTADISSASASSILEGVDENSLPLFRIGKRVGSGSYGTVHQGYLIRTMDDIQPCIAKRAWTLDELESSVPSRILKSEQGEKKRLEQLAVAQRTGLVSAKLAQNDIVVELNDDAEPLSPSELKMRGERCRHYWKVEAHCFQKIEEKIKIANDNDVVRAAPAFLGVYKDDGSSEQLGGSEAVVGYGLLGKEESSNGWFSSSNIGDADTGKGHTWMAFEYVGSAMDITSTSAVGEPSQTLLDAMERDWKDQHLQSGTGNHHLYDIQKAMNLPETYTFGDTLDAIFLSLLQNLKEIHDCNIVHRDLKPGNLLCDGSSQRLRLIDFGSAADLDPSPIKGNALENIFSGTQRVGYDEGIVAISPVYSAPETFVKLNDNPLSFDVFSAALIMSQLLFNLLDERTDVGFLQQLKEVDYDLDSWLEKELGAKLRPAGIVSGIEYLGERRGMWGLLKNMFEKNPMKRITSSQALKRLNKIMGLQNGEIEWSDDIILEVAHEESYFETVVESFERCAVDLEMPRPLHFLASFKKGSPMGFFLAEASEVENDGSMSSGEWDQWQRATQRALPGEVFVKGWEDGSQADQLGLFQIGDRLRGVGELPFVDGGFEQAIKLINLQPKGGSLKLHFDRISRPKSPPKSDQMKDDSRYVRVAGQGTWKSGGRRGNQEDSFVLHEIKNDKIGDVLLAGVFDGHAGTAASETCSKVMPPLFTQKLLDSCLSSTDAAYSIQEALEESWQITCDTYRDGCDANGECVADYDPREGILFAETGSRDLFVAGTTATIAAISMNPQGTNDLAVLNCGDSRTLVVGEPSDEGSSFVVFETRDHSPDDELEIERLERGKESGLDYSIPQCSMTSGSYMVVGDYQYALCRSLEGSYVTSKGIVSDPDVSILNLASLLADRQQNTCALVLACDGLFEVMSNEEVGREVVRMRSEGYKAGDIAKNLCGKALKKGSYDNLSVVIVYLDDV
ncbi:hypothetical protein ACHAXR_008256 [Thalassiosira sp. AJA248-18]